MNVSLISWTDIFHNSRRNRIVHMLWSCCSLLSCNLFLSFYIQGMLLSNCQEAARRGGSVLSWNGALGPWAGGVGGVLGQVRGTWGPDTNNFKSFSHLRSSIVSATRTHVKLALCTWVIFHPIGHCFLVTPWENQNSWSHLRHSVNGFGPSLFLSPFFPPVFLQTHTSQTWSF